MTTTTTNNTNIYRYTALHNEQLQAQSQTTFPSTTTSTQSQSLRQRQRKLAPYVADTNAASPFSDHAHNTNTTTVQRHTQTTHGTVVPYYASSDTAMLFLATSLPLIIVIWSNSSKDDDVLLHPVLSVVVLILYCVDLWGPNANVRDISQLIVWVGLFVFPACWSLIRHFVLLSSSSSTVVGNNTSSGIIGSMFLALAHCGVEIVAWLCLVSALMLQFLEAAPDDANFGEGASMNTRNHHPQNQNPSAMTSILFIYALLPSAAAGLISWYIVDANAAIFNHAHFSSMPHLYWTVTALYHIILGPYFCTSYHEHVTMLWNHHHSMIIAQYNRTRICTVQLILWTVVPGFMQFVMMLRRADDIDGYDWYDWILTCTAPVCALELMVSYKALWWWNNSTTSTADSKNNVGMTDYFNFKFVSRVCRVLCFLALQQRYLTPLCLDVQFYLLGPKDMASYWVVTAYLAAGNLLCAATYFVLYNARMQELLGEGSEDVAMSVLAFGAFLYNCAFGLPWTISPTFILCCMSIALFSISKQVRYLLIFLVVIAMSLSAMIMFRASFLRTIEVGGMSLLWFGYLTVIALLFIGTAVGFTFRAADGIGYNLKVDSVGLLLCAYALLLCFLETALVATRGSEHEAALYYPVHFALGTSTLLLFICRNLWKQKKISAISIVAVSSLAVGKLCCYLSVDPDASSSSSSDAVAIRTFAAAILLFVLVSPYVILEPIGDPVNKTNHPYSHNAAAGPSYFSRTTNSSSSSSSSARFLKFYMMILPLVIISSSTIVIQPLLQNICSALFANMRTICRMEIIGMGLFLWGIETVSVINYALKQTDKFGQSLKKVGVIALLVGLGLVLGGSSLQVLEDSRTQSLLLTYSEAATGRGGARLGAPWGAVLAIASCLLALSGALDFRPATGKRMSKGKALLALSGALDFRPATGKRMSKVKAIVFCILFGTGGTLFIARSISSAPIGYISFILLSLVTTYGTFCAIHNHFCDVNGIHAISAVLPWSAVAMFVFVIVSMISSMDSTAVCTIFASLCALTLCLWSVALRCRKIKNSTTITLANALCVASWLLAVAGVYCRFGLSNINSVGRSNGMMGIPYSIIGTFLVSPILLCLEQLRHDGSDYHRASRYNPSMHYKAGHSPRISIRIISSPMKVAFAGTCAVLFIASFYAIVLRGCGIFSLGVHKNHEDVFASVYGEGSRSSAASSGNSPALLKKLVHDKVIEASAQLASAGFCSSTHWGGPILHFLGLLALCPNLYAFFLSVLSPTTMSHQWTWVAFALPLTLFTLVACRAVASLSVLAVLTLGGGGYQIFSLNRAQRSRKMRI
eukprot:CAMPEP_0196825662 /NCGR_PEP_ID=MMETSP1362-20130617/93190_1 /TAXON_ID=163516 /ORGANISM="Leptocylindrus danicus, Strain CCMP1856" /LENGTH=1321 /DNA_ID=CAMNT_0042206137 /DNA_START=55 /DNA_END=4020 /DNA_ORIENTATION=-